MPAPPTSKQQESIKSPANTKTYGSGTSTQYGGRASTSGTSTSYGGKSTVSAGTRSGTGGGGGTLSQAQSKGKSGYAPGSGGTTARPGTGSSTAGGGGSKTLPVSRPFSYAGPKGALSLNPAARYASVGGVGMMPTVPASASDLDKMARMMLAESSVITNPRGGISTEGLSGVGEVIRNRILSGKYPDTVTDVLGQKKQFSPMSDGSIKRYSPSSPGYQSAYDVAKAIMSGEAAPTVGGSLNYANFDTVYDPKKSQASAATKKGFGGMTPIKTVYSSASPDFQHTFGTWGNKSDVTLPSISPGMSPAPMASTPVSYTSPSSAGPSPVPQSSGMLSGLLGGAKDIWEGVKPSYASLADTVNALPGTPDQKAKIVNSYAYDGPLAAAGSYLKAAFGGGGDSGGFRHPDEKNQAPMNPGLGQQAQNVTQGQQGPAMTPEQQLQTLSLDPKQRVLLQQYMGNGMTFEQAIQVLNGGGQTASGPSPWSFPQMTTRPYTRIA